MAVLSLHNEWCATIHVGTVSPLHVLWRHKAYTSYAFRHLVQYIHFVLGISSMCEVVLSLNLWSQI